MSNDLIDGGVTASNTGSGFTSVSGVSEEQETVRVVLGSYAVDVPLGVTKITVDSNGDVYTPDKKYIGTVGVSDPKGGTLIGDHKVKQPK